MYRLILWNKILFLHKLYNYLSNLYFIIIIYIYIFYIKSQLFTFIFTAFINNFIPNEIKILNLLEIKSNFILKMHDVFYYVGWIF